MSHLNDVCSTSNIELSSPMKTFNFSVSATFQNRFTITVFTGSYAADRAFSLSAVFTD